MPTGYIVDVMAYVRKIPTSSIGTFGKVCEKLSGMIVGICKHPKRIYFNFDTYIERSVKDNERQTRTSKPHVRLSHISCETMLPKDTDSFRPSASNKTKFEELLGRWLIENITQKVMNAQFVLEELQGTIFL